MGAQRPSFPASDIDDLETTAELPILGDTLASTDTWVVPVAMPPDPEEDPAAQQAVVQGKSDEIGALRSDLANAAESRGRLELDLRELSSNLQHVEDRLRRKGERLADLERQLAAAKTAAEAADARANLAAAEFDRLGSQIEHERGVAQALTRDLDARSLAVSALEARGAELAGEADRLRHDLQALRDELTARGRDVAARDREVAARDARIAELSDACAAAERKAGTERESQSSLQVEMHGLQARSQLLLERLHTRENARGIYEAIYLDLESRIEAQQHDAGALAASLERNGGRAQELESALTEARLRITALETEAAQNTATLAAKTEAHALVTGECRTLQETIGSLEAALVSRKTQIEHLEADAARHKEAMQTRATEFEADLRVAEERVHLLESELRSRSARLEEISAASAEWRDTLSSARRSISERDDQIRKLESEAASSAAVLGNIRESMQRIDPLAATGGEQALEGALRLLTRMEGGTEVVHVLGRKTTVGRTPDNDLQIDAKFISRHHAVLLSGPTLTIVEDLNSTNGVYVNGRKIAREALEDGDTLVIGKTQFRFSLRNIQERR